MIQPLVYLIRGVSGCGKNFFADSIKFLYPETVICSADDYYIHKYGEYKFHWSEIEASHDYCREKFLHALINKQKVIVVNNTNINENQFGFYIDAAKKYNYKLISLVIENRHGGTNIHNIPPESLEKQKINIKQSLKLI